MTSVAHMHAVRPRCQKLITSARTEVVRCHMQNTNTTPFATKNRTNQMSSVMVVLSQALHPCTLCLRTFLQALEKTWLDGKRRPKREQLLFQSLVQLCRSADSTHHKHGLEIGLETKSLQMQLFITPKRITVEQDLDCSIQRLAKTKTSLQNAKRFVRKRVAAERRDLATSPSRMR